MSSRFGGEQGPSFASGAETLIQRMEALGKIKSKSQALAAQDAVDGPDFISFLQAFEEDVTGRFLSMADPFADFNMPVPAEIRHHVRDVFVDSRRVKVGLGTGSIIQETKMPGLFFRNDRGMLSNQRVYSLGK